MSYWLYATCLVWHGANGLAKLHGREIHLVRKPRIGQLQFDLIRYVPEIDWKVLRIGNGRERVLVREEVRIVDQWLLDTFAGGLDG